MQMNSNTEPGISIPTTKWMVQQLTIIIFKSSYVVTNDANITFIVCDIICIGEMRMPEEMDIEGKWSYTKNRRRKPQFSIYFIFCICDTWCLALQIANAKLFICMDKHFGM